MQECHSLLHWSHRHSCLKFAVVSISAPEKSSDVIGFSREHRLHSPNPSNRSQYLQKRITYAGHIMFRRVSRHDEVLQDSHQLRNKLQKDNTRQKKGIKAVCYNCQISAVTLKKKKNLYDLEMKSLPIKLLNQ